PAGDRFPDQHRPRRTRPAARRPGTAPPPPRPRGGPHPRGEGHRDAQPALPRHHPEPDLAGHHRAGQRAPGLDHAARPPAHRSALRTETAPAAHPRHRRTARADRPPNHPQDRPGLALGERDHPRPHPTPRAPRALSTPPTPRPGPRSTGTTTLSRRSRTPTTRTVR